MPRKEIWLKAGYSEFAKYGPHALKADKLAKKVGKARSSFYHLFGDMEGFREALYEFHWTRSQEILKALDNAQTFHPDFANILEENKGWGFFQMQTYHNRETCEGCRNIFDKVTSEIEPKIGHLWAKSADIGDIPIEKTTELYRVIREGFFARLNYDTYSAKVFREILTELNTSIEFLLKSIR